MSFTICHGKRLDETLKFPRLSSLGSFKVSASVSEAATSRLGLISDFKHLVLDKILNVSVLSESRRHGSLVLSRSRLRRSRAHLCGVYMRKTAIYELLSELTESV